MKYPNTKKLNKAEADLINDLCPNEKAKFDEWLNELKSRYLHLIGYIDIRYWYDVFMSGAGVSEAAAMIQTPCIMKFKDDYLLYFDDIRHFNLTTMELRNSTIESCDSNVTNQYLQNTYGEVQSPEHAEFIVELGKNAGFSVWCLRCTKNLTSFTFHDTELCLFEIETKQLDLRGLKQITIPLPPKADKQGLSEWPQIGDEAVLVSMGMTMHNKPVRLTYIGDGVGCYVDSTNGTEYTYAKRETVFKKPKTPEDELRDEISSYILLHFSDMKCEDIASHIVKTYIKKEV